jgi:hypothetical protein
MTFRRIVVLLEILVFVARPNAKTLRPLFDAILTFAHVPDCHACQKPATGPMSALPL